MTTWPRFLDLDVQGRGLPGLGSAALRVGGEQGQLDRGGESRRRQSAAVRPAVTASWTRSVSESSRGRETDAATAARPRTIANSSSARRRCTPRILGAQAVTTPVGAPIRPGMTLLHQARARVRAGGPGGHRNRCLRRRPGAGDGTAPDHRQLARAKPPGFRLSAGEAVAIAERVPRCATRSPRAPGAAGRAPPLHGRSPPLAGDLQPRRQGRGRGARGRAPRARARAVDRAPGRLPARPAAGATRLGGALNAAWIWIPPVRPVHGAVLGPAAAAAAAPPRPGRAALLRRRPAALQRGQAGVWVPAVYPVLGYPARAAGGWGCRRASGSAAHAGSAGIWLLVGLLALLAARIVLNLDSTVIDVGYASVVGADRIEGRSSTPPTRSTASYGPLNYLAYVPFELALPWHGAGTACRRARRARSTC